MKTYFKALFVLTLTVFVFSQGFAQTSEKSITTGPANGTTAMGKFVDTNNNGICDNHEMKDKAGQCANFVDKDGNGICDNCPKNANAGQSAACQGHKEGMGCGQAKAGCGANCKNQGMSKGKCCANQQVTPDVTPAETPDPKK